MCSGVSKDSGISHTQTPGIYSAKTQKSCDMENSDPKGHCSGKWHQPIGTLSWFIPYVSCPGSALSTPAKVVNMLWWMKTHQKRSHHNKSVNRLHSKHWMKHALQIDRHRTSQLQERTLKRIRRDTVNTEQKKKKTDSDSTENENTQHK